MPTFYWEVRCPVHGKINGIDGGEYPVPPNTWNQGLAALRTTADDVTGISSALRTSNQCPVDDVAQLVSGTLRLIANDGGAIVSSQTVTGTLDASTGKLKIPQGTSAPSGSEGELFFDTDDNILKVHDGSSFTDLGGLSASDEQLLHNIAYTGILTGGNLTINGDNTKFDITSGAGIVVNNHTDPTNPTITRVSWNAFTAQTPAGLATTDFTYVAIDNTGSLIQQTTEFTFEQARTHIIVGRMGHATHTIIQAVAMFPRVAFNPFLEFADFMKVFDAININGNVYSTNGANLQVNKSSGQSYRLGANYPNDKQRPSVTSDPVGTAITLFYHKRDGIGGWTIASGVTSVDPAQYDDGDGTLAAVGAAQFTIQPIFHFPGSGATAIQYGQALYVSIAEAEANIHTVVDINPALDQAVIRGWLIVRGDATALNDVVQAKFIQAGKFGLTDIIIGTNGGEANTVSNVGAGGVGLFKQKSGVDLQFKNVNSATSSPITITDDAGNSEVDVGLSVGTSLEVSGGNLRLGQGGNAHVLADATGLGVEHSVSGLTAGQFLRATAATTARFEAIAFAKGTTVVFPDVRNIIMWRAPFACTVTAVKGYRVGGTGATINARRNGADNHLASALSLTSADTWTDGGAVQNTAYAIGDKLEAMIVTVTGDPTQVAIQIDFSRP